MNLIKCCNIFVFLHIKNYLKLVLLFFAFIDSIQVLISGFIVVMVVSSKMRKDLILFSFHSECQ